MIKLSYLIFKIILRVRRFYHLDFACKLKKVLGACDKGRAELRPRGGGCSEPWVVTAVSLWGSQAWKATWVPLSKSPAGRRGYAER